MRSLGQLVAGVAHELNNPISFVSANVEHLRDYTQRLERALDAYADAPWPPEARAGFEAMCRELRIDQVLADLPSLLADCEEGARRTKRIVNDLRTFSRSEGRETWRSTDLHVGIESTLALLNHRFQDRITVHRDFGDLPEVECLPGQLNQVFMNLLANAADAMGKRPGNIWISTKVSAREATLQSPEPAVVIEIRDDGPGMTADIRSRIFEPFFTTKDVGQGTGLGLSISYAIVQSHGGTLGVESSPGAGTTFTIVLPVRRSASQPNPDAA
jgi:signal transduction histidine kinase